MRKACAGLWPRGRYNGRRVAGAKLSLAVDVSRWTWLPRLRLGGDAQVHLLCLLLRLEPVYHVGD